jgi:hypothetical protein
VKEKGHGHLVELQYLENSEGPQDFLEGNLVADL